MHDKVYLIYNESDAYWSLIGVCDSLGAANTLVDAHVQGLYGLPDRGHIVSHSVWAKHGGSMRCHIEVSINNGDFYFTELFEAREEKVHHVSGS